MKTFLALRASAPLTLCLILGFIFPARAQLIINSPTLNLSIPDGDSVGASDTLTVPPGSQDTHITDLTLILNVDGDWVGDLYAQVTHDGQQAVLLNRVGRTLTAPLGYDDSAMDVRLNDAAPQGDIHIYRVTLSNDPAVPLNGPLTGLWAPDGRNVAPTTVLDTDPRIATLGAFNGQNPTGDWRIFLADVDPGGQNTLVSWGLEMTTVAVPEPQGWTVIFAAVCLVIAALRRTRWAVLSPKPPSRCENARAE